MEEYAKDTLEFEGRKFEVKRFSDTDSGPSWEDGDGYGIIRQVYSGHGRPEKRPGEVIIHYDRGDYWLYDLNATTAKAKKEGWGIGDDEKAKLAASLGREPTKNEVIAEAVQRDLKLHRGFLREDWWYIGVSVRILGPDGKPEGRDYDHALWGVESSGDYWKEVAEDLAEEILHAKRKVWRKALKERRAQRYWASRDIITA